ncbi:MAG: hypothetical protein ACR2LE_00925, partial [Nocardioidaceae bacterium]
TTHRGTSEATEELHGTGGDLALPRPPWVAITDLVRRYLGPQPRAGLSVLPSDIHGGDEAAIYRGAGFTGPAKLNVPGRRVERTAEQIVAAVHSLSSAAPHLFGNRLDAFDTDLRHLLTTAHDDGYFGEEMPSIGVDIWRPKGSNPVTG